MFLKQIQFKKLITSLILLFIIGTFAIGIKVALAQPDVGFEYATALSLGTRDLRAMVVQVINVFLGFLGIIAIGVILYGGYLYLTSSGSEDKIAQAKKVLINGVIGLAIILMSYAIAYFIMTALINATGGGGGGEPPPPPPPLPGANCEDPLPGTDKPYMCSFEPTPSAAREQFVTLYGSEFGDYEEGVSKVELYDNNTYYELEVVDCAGNDSKSWSDSRIIVEVPIDIPLSPPNYNWQITAYNGSPVIFAGDIDEWGSNLLIKTLTVTADNPGPGIACIVPDHGQEEVLVTVYGKRLESVPQNSDDKITFYDGLDIKFNIAGYWPLDEIDGSTTPDANSNGNDGTLIGGPVLTSGHIGNAVEFAGNGDYIRVPNSSSLQMGTNNITLSAWIYPKSGIDPEYFIIIIGGEGGYSFSIYPAGSPNWRIYAYLSDGINGSNGFAGTTAISFDTWSHVAVVFDRTTGQAKSYLNGVYDSYLDISSVTGPVNPTADLTINRSANYRFTGSIDDVVIYKNALSGDEILDIYNNGVQVTASIVTSWSSELIEVNVPFGAISTPYDEEVYVYTFDGGNSNEINFTVDCGGGGAPSGCNSGCCYEPGAECREDAWCGGGIGDPCDDVPACGSGEDGCQPGLYCEEDSCTCQSGLPRIDWVDPGDGAIGNWISIGGDNFGEIAGTVYFCSGTGCQTDGSGADWLAAIVPSCSLAWSDNFIITEVPTGAIDGPIKIVANLGNTFFDTTHNSNGLIINDFDVNSTVRPGLCGINPVSGRFGDSFTITGKNFTVPDLSAIYFGNTDDYPASGLGVISDTQASGNVPNVQKGEAGVYASTTERSNPVIYNITSSPDDPRINYFEPESGPVDEYITIYGSGFGDSKGSNGDVLFNGVSGSFDFPQQCGDNFWSDTQIIVKAPSGASTGVIKVINNNTAWDDTSDLEPSDFVIEAGIAGPGICKIKPVSGPLGVGVDIFGERFTGATEDVKFSFDKSADSFITSGDEEINNAVVPGSSTADDTTDDAVSGPINSVVDGNTSNGYNFQVFDCRAASNGCAAIGYDGFDCCYNGTCAASGECSTPTAATYQWDFSSGTASTCSGYSLNQCLAATTCPNSPGQCSPSPGETVDTDVDCGSDYCNSDNFSQCQFTPDCSYNSDNNFCELSGLSCNISSTFSSENITCNQYSGTYPRVAYWQFEEVSGDSVLDSAGSNDGYINPVGIGAVRVDGRFDRALEFDGVDDYVSTPINNVSGAFSAAVWIKLNNLTDPFASIISKYTYDPLTGDGFFIRQKNDHIQVCISEISSTSYNCIDTWTLQADVWYYIAASYNGSVLSVFLDGSFVDSVSGPMTDNGLTLTIGSTYNDGSENFDGLIDEVAIYDRALSADEIKARYVSGNKDYVWQYSTSSNCLPGSFMDNGKCILGSIDKPTLCAGCQDGFSCSEVSGGNGACVIDQAICPSGSTCEDFDSDGYDDCVENIEGTCECCCRVGESETDCCAGLTCENDDCGATDIDIDGDNIYDPGDGDIFWGYCTGCAIWGDGTLLQSQSDDECGCTSNTRICVVDGNNESDGDTGFCGDCETINTTSLINEDVQTECESHNVCCYDGSVGGDGCYTCDDLRVVENMCVDGENLVGHWDFEENTGTVAGDISGNNNDGELKNMEEDDWVDGNIGGALDFDGSDDYVNVGSIFDGNLDQLSVSAWVKYDSFVDGGPCDPTCPTTGPIVAVKDWWSDGKGFALRIYNDTLLFTLMDGTPEIAYNAGNSTTTLFDTWYHVVGTFDGSDIKLYVDNIEVGSVSYSGQVIDPTNEIWIGRDIINNGKTDGIIDDVRIYNTALSPGEITSLYLTGSTNYALPSPAPVNSAEDVCINAVISATFNLDLDDTTFPYGILAQKCDPSCSGSVSGITSLSADNKSFIFNPTADFESNTSYQVTIDQDLKSTEDSGGRRLNKDYVWNFQTGTTQCAPDSVVVLPQTAILTEVGVTQDYTAFPLQQCNILTDTYSWGWASAESNIATVSGSVLSTETATAGLEDGTTTISADITTESIDATGKAKLTVQLESPEVIDYWPNCTEACLNASVGAEFNVDMYNSSLTSSGNIKLYKWFCGNGLVETGEDCDDGDTKSNDGCSGIPVTNSAVCSAIIDQTSCENENIDCFWDGASCLDYSLASAQEECRDANGYWDGLACVDNQGCLNEGSDGSIAICGNDIIETGEDCDGAQGCDANCLNTGYVLGLSICSDGLIGEGEDCDDGGVITDDGCSDICLNEGTDEFNEESITIEPYDSDTAVNINLLSGYFDPLTYYRVFITDNIISTALKPLTKLNYDKDNDDVDDSFSWSFKTKDEYCGPSSVLLDPSQKTIYTIGYGQNYEASVYGVPDACSVDGQKLDSYDYNWDWNSTVESVATITNNNNWPSCGNGKIEIGEDCDDSNSSDGDGCSSLCLNEGTTTDMGLVSYWALDEGSDVFAYDSISNNDGTLIDGPEWIGGKFSNALSFDGVDDYVEILGDSASLEDLTDDGNDFSFSVWFKPSGLPKQTGSGYIIMRIGYHLGIAQKTNGNLSAILRYDDSTNLSISGGALQSGVWYHLAITVDEINNEFELYLDGSRVGIVNITQPLREYGTANYYLGGFDEYKAYGVIDDVRIYNTALTGAQVVGIMSQKDYLCGNGTVDFGEDCDGSPFPLGCDINTCLNEGGVANTVCGNGLLETGEDCDDGNVDTGDGCSNICLNEGAQNDSYIDFYQTATTKSPGTTNIQADVNYCSDLPIYTCDVGVYSCSPGICDTGGTDTCVNNPLVSCAADADCDFGDCNQAFGTSELEVICGFESDAACSQGICSGGTCTNNPDETCSTDADCDLSDLADTTCNVDAANHTCSLETWGGTCSVSTDTICYSNDDCPAAESCEAATDCNYCYNNSFFECRASNDLVPGPGNSDCRLGVGASSCCYSRPRVDKNYPDPNYFDFLTNPLALDCTDNILIGDNSDDYCSAFDSSVECQTYICNDTDADLVPDTCSAYGKCFDGVDYASPDIYCLSDNDCPQDAYSTCNKSCSNDSDCNDIICGTCRNAQIAITFDKLMDTSSFTDNGVCANNSTASCNGDSDCGSSICLSNIRLGIKYDDAAVNQKSCPSGLVMDQNLAHTPPKSFIARIAAKFKSWWNKLLGRQETIAAEYWCAIPGAINSVNSNNRTTAIFTPQGLNDNLFEPGFTYRAIIKEDIKSQAGVKMSGDVNYEFTVGDTACEVETVEIYISD